MGTKRDNRNGVCLPCWVKRRFTIIKAAKTQMSCEKQYPEIVDNGLSVCQ